MKREARDKLRLRAQRALLRLQLDAQLDSSQAARWSARFGDEIVTGPRRALGEIARQLRAQLAVVDDNARQQRDQTNRRNASARGAVRRKIPSRKEIILRFGDVLLVELVQPRAGRRPAELRARTALRMELEAEYHRSTSTVQGWIRKAIGSK